MDGVAVASLLVAVSTSERQKICATCNGLALLLDNKRTNVFAIELICNFHLKWVTGSFLSNLSSTSIHDKMGRDTAVWNANH